MKPAYTKTEVEAQIEACDDFDHLHLLIDVMLHHERKNYTPEEFMDILLNLIRKYAEISFSPLRPASEDRLLKELTDCLLDVSFWRCKICDFPNPKDSPFCLKCVGVLDR
ncbi:hypothetical protein [Rufibacter ruber]|uniref:hypothetical protein n=1 Tax=Rufibacter ruber TaxID=1783499 RepID=UPI00083115F9|nr:hypothetical protein [Rufibacter ruber]